MKQNSNKIIKQKGFTLLELTVAIFVIMVGIVGALSALQKATSTTFVSSSKLTAAYLAQEGIEIVRNLRDTNWIADLSWDNGIICCFASPCDCEADYNDKYLNLYQENHYLRIDNGFFNYDLGEETKFKRKITISKEPDILKISVQVSWKERGKDFQLTAQENIYDWK